MAAGSKGKTFIRFNNKYVFIDLFHICQGLWEFSRKFFAVGLRGKRGWGCPLGVGVDFWGFAQEVCQCWRWNPLGP